MRHPQTMLRRLSAPLLAVSTLLPIIGQDVLPHSATPDPSQQWTQVMGSRCQTPFGICPLVDPNGQAYAAPVGSPCACGTDAGSVIQ